MKQNLIFTLFLLVLLNTTVSAQFLTGVNPDSAYQGQSLAVTISGQSTNFQQGSSVLQVWLNQGTITIYPLFNVVHNSQLVESHFSIPPNANLGLWDVNVWTLIDGTMTRNNDFLIYNPNVSAIKDIVQETFDTFEIFPNPLTELSQVRFTLQERSHIVVELFDINGKSISTLDDQIRESGSYELDLGTAVINAAPGQYLIRFSIDDVVLVRRLIR